MTIKQKLACSFILMIFLVAAVGIVMQQSSRRRGVYYTNTLAAIKSNNMIKEINFFIDQQLKAVDYYILLEDDDQRRQFEEYVLVMQDKFSEWYGISRNPDMKREVAELNDMYNETIRIAREVIILQKKGKRRNAINMMDSSFIPKEKKLRSTLDMVVKERNQASQQAQEKAQNILKQQAVISQGVIALSVVLGITLSLIIFNSIARPLNILKKGAAAIGDGKLDFRLQLNQNDEFGSLARSFNEMAENLQKMQAQIVQLDRMSAIGQLAGGVAHELNNPLTGVLGQAQILLHKIPQDNPMHNSVLKIERAALRCRKIVRELLDFSRQKEYIFQKTDIHELIDSTLLLCESDLGAFQAQIVKQYYPHIEHIAVSPPHVQQVFLNMINNAMHAMKSGGRLIISTRVLEHGFTINDRRKDNQQLTVRGKWLEISFADTGMGIDPKNISHVFDPFFTTKDVGKGTGLGLTISYGIIQNHKGNISVESDGIGRGANFIIRLPYDREVSSFA
ncbi:MAG: ATP-binding protein [bacterium]